MNDEPEIDDLPSKSARKREAHERQKLGERLVSMRESDLDALNLPAPLPEELRDALREARRLTSRGALGRQRQYIGRLMRDVDLPPLQEALAARDSAQAQHARMRR